MIGSARLQRGMVLGVFGAFLLGPSVAAASSTTAKRAAAIFNAVGVKVINRDRHCSPRPRPGRGVHGPPSRAIIDTFAVLRRPATAADLAPADVLLDLEYNDVFVDSVRLATGSDQRQFWIVPARQTNPFLTPEHCLRRFHYALRRRLRHEVAAVRRRTIHYYNVLRANHRREKRRKPPETVFAFPDAAGACGSTGGQTLRDLRSGAGFAAESHGGPQSCLTGLIPDGVASIDFTFAPRYSRGTGHKPRTYPAAIETSVAVADNIVALKVTRDVEDAFPSKMVWRDSGGRIVRVFRAFP